MPETKNTCPSGKHLRFPGIRGNICMALFLACAFFSCPGAELKRGDTGVEIVISDAPTPTAKFAAKELQAALKQPRYDNRVPRAGKMGFRLDRLYGFEGLTEIPSGTDGFAFSGGKEPGFPEKTLGFHGRAKRSSRSAGGNGDAAHGCPG